MTHQAEIVGTENELRTAVVSQKPVIVLKNEDMFWKIEKQIRGAMGSRKVEKAGNVVMLGGGATVGVALGIGAAALFWPAVAVLAAGTGTKVLGNIGDKAFRRHFQNYTSFFDYNSKCVFLLKYRGEGHIEAKDKPWIDIKNVYSPLPTKVELRLPDGTSFSNRIENGIMKLFIE